MSRTPGRPTARVVACASALALAVAIMHVLVLCGLGTHAGTGTHAGAGHAMPTMSAGAPHLDRIGASMTDCATHDHGCVFVRGELIVLTVALGFVGLLAPLRRLIGLSSPRLVVVLGRPPPWAIPDHLDLAVIVR